MLEKLKSIEEIVNQNKEHMLRDSINIKSEHSLNDYSKIIEHLERLKDESRLLKVGIIGKVKAGKSSLLNALLFEGEDVLPKAATPMTAALTEISYGEKYKFSVEYYSARDYKDILDLAKFYEEMYEKKREKIYNELVEKAREKKKKRLPKFIKNADKQEEINEEEIDEKKLSEQAEKKAKKDIEDMGDSYLSAYNQLKDIKNARINIEELLGREVQIEAENLSDLQKKLEDYVGANGEYTPFVKVSKIEMPFEGLRDLVVVDTPGVNDPIVSREEKTKQMLKDCDVIFMVTASGASLSATDIELLDRVESKEGIKNVYIVVSKMDMSLPINHDDNSQDLDEELMKLKGKMRERKDQVIAGNSKFKKIVKGEVILTAGHIYSIGKLIKENKELDENMKNTLGRLRKYFPDYLPENNKEVLYENLMKIANINEIKGKMEEIRRDKVEIQREKNEEALVVINKNILSYFEKLKEAIKDKKRNIENGDISKIREEAKYLNKQKEKMEIEFLGTYGELVDDLSLDIKKRLTKIVNFKVQEIMNEINGAKSTESRTMMVDKPDVISWCARLFGVGGREERSYTQNILNTGPIKSRLLMLNGSTQDEIEIEYGEIIQKWKKNISRILVENIEGNLDMENSNFESINEGMLKSIVRNIVSKVQTPKMFEKVQIPAILNQSARLESYEASRYEEEAYKYIENFNNEYRGRVDKILREIDTTIGKYNPLQKVIDEIDKNISELIFNIENKEKSLSELILILKQMEEIM